MRRFSLFLAGAACLLVMPVCAEIAGTPLSGAPIPSNGYLELLNGYRDLSRSLIEAGVSDTASGLGYFGTYAMPGSIIKVRFNASTGNPEIASSIRLNPGEGQITCAVADPVNGVAYFGTDTFPPLVIKVRFTATINQPARIGALEVPAATAFTCATFDPVDNCVYFGSSQTPGRVAKIAGGAADAPPTLVGVTMLDAGEGPLRGAVSGTGAGNRFALFGTQTTPARIVKVMFNGPAEFPGRASALTLPAGENTATCAAANGSANTALFGLSGGRIVKVAMGAGTAAPTRSGHVDSGVASLHTALPLPSGDVLFASRGGTASVVRASFGAGANPAASALATGFPADSGLLAAGAVLGTASGGLAVFADADEEGTLHRVQANTSGAPAATGSGSIFVDIPAMSVCLIDTDAGHVYGVSEPPSPRFFKFDITGTTSGPSLIGSIDLSTSTRVNCGVIDTVTKHALLGTADAPGRVLKVGLGAGSALPTLLPSLTLTGGGGDDNLRHAVYDAVQREALFASGSTPGALIKVSMSAGNAAPTRIDRLALGANDGPIWGMDYLPAAQRAIVLADAPAQDTRLILVDIGLPGANADRGNQRTFSQIVGEGSAVAASPDEGYAIVSGSPRSISRLQLFANGAAPAFLETRTLVDGVGVPNPILWPSDTNRLALISSQAINSLGVRFTPGGAAEEGFYTFPSNTQLPGVGAIDPVRGYAYVFSNDEPQNLSRLAYSPRGAIRGTRITMPEDGILERLVFFSHVPLNARCILSLYRDDENTLTRVATTGTFTSNTNGGFLARDIDGNIPLPAGEYWLAWQSESSADSPSWIFGQGSSFISQNGFTSPTTVPKSRISTNLGSWACYVNYRRPDGSDTWLVE